MISFGAGVAWQVGQWSVITLYCFQSAFRKFLSCMDLSTKATRLWVRIREGWGL